MASTLLIFLSLLLSFSTLYGFEDFNLVPVSFQGRFMPAESYSRQWLYQRIHNSDLPPLVQTSSQIPLEFLWNVYFTSLKKTQLTQSEEALARSFNQLMNSELTSKETALQLEQQHPLLTRLADSGILFKVLPGKFKPGEWYSLLALHATTYNPKTEKLELVKNFTLYPDSLFQSIRTTYFQLEIAFDADNATEVFTLKKQLAHLLLEGYKLLANRPYQEALGKKLTYPSMLQLYAETLYASYPLTLICIAGYGLTLAFFILALLLNRPLFTSAAFFLLVATFCLHTFILILRCYILERPPVSNMLETMLYVPWVTVLISILLSLIFSTPFLLIASSSAALTLLILLQLNFHTSSFENVQAVLDSRYWLFTHVLMVVGSYGLFLLGSLLGHLYLAGLAYYRQEIPTLTLIANALLQVLYLGVALLVAGTLLGGVWAAQSWGRFWDWDPKESWAFISICIYLLWIHAYRFGKITHLGLSIGSILGFLAISFTWYGVNYILGTGLHSYGFGNGGSSFYYGFIFTELLFLAAVLRYHHLSKRIDKKRPTC
ncbi:MAG: cytochrome c biogenesis protein CcsA [Parachlamydiaceae bacterium]|nr:cytochrome c biogenesis protein CcsA [Parachlamydiaceae bacterium]